MKRRTKFVVAATAGAALLAVAVVARELRRMASLAEGGVVVTVTNDTSAPIRDVWIETTGGRWPVGVLEPSADAEARVTVAGESSVVVGWTNQAGDAVAWDADVYFEPNLGGHVDAAIAGPDTLVVSSPHGSPYRRVPPAPTPPPRPR